MPKPINHRKLFLDRIQKYADVIIADSVDGFSPADCVDDIVAKAPPGDRHAAWISANREECEAAIAGIMGLM